MAGHTFTTELVTEELTLGLYDPSGVFAVPVKRVAEKQGLAVVSLTQTGSELHQVVSSCYKVIVALTPASCTEQVFETLKQLQEYQEKVVVWIPAVTVWEEQVTGEVPFAADFFALQQAVIDQVNVLLSQAVLVLGKDVILPPGYGSTLDLLFQRIPDHVVFIPQMQLTPVGFAEFVVHALAQSIKPDRISTQISGQLVSGKVLVESVAHPYEQYYFHQLAHQPIVGTVVALVNFPLQKVVVPSSAYEALKWYSRQLPSPENWRGILPSIAHHPLHKNFSSESAFYQEVSYSSPSLRTAPPAQPQYHHAAVSVQSLPFVVPSPTVQTKSVPASPPPEQQVDRVPDPFTESPSILTEQFDVQDELHRIFGSTRSREKIERVTSLVADTKKITKRSKKRTTAFYGGLAFTGAGLGVLFLILVFVLSTNMLKSSLAQTVQSLAEGRDVQASQWQRLSRTTHFVLAQARGYEAVVSLPQISAAQQLADLSTAVQESKASLNQLQDAQKTGFARIVGTETQSSENSQNVLAELVTAHEKVVATDDYLQQNTLGTAVDEFVLTAFTQQRTSLERSLLLYQSFTPLWPDMTGQTRSRTYAVVFQNNQELRPTGGIVEAFALLTFSRGALTEYKVFSSYEVKDKTPGVVTPPPEITQYLGEEQLYLYDANWEPDFAKASSRMQFFIENATNTSLDGMLSIDVYAMQRLLEVTGPLELPEFNEVITAENIFERLEAHPEYVLVQDGKNKDYRVVLLSHLIAAVQALPPEKSPALLVALDKNFSDQSHQWFSLHDEEQQTLQNLGWAGTVLYPKCPAEFGTAQCVLDSLYQVEANVGVNKANYYLDRSQQETIKIGTEKITHQLTTTFENTAQSTSWPKGTYKTFIRWYLPEKANTASVSIDGTPVPSEQLTVSNAYDRQLLGVYVEVPISDTRTVKLEYSLPFSAEGETHSYAYLRQRQPGSGVTAAQVRIEYEPSFSPLLIAPEAEARTGVIEFALDSLETSLFAVQFTSSQ